MQKNNHAHILGGNVFFPVNWEIYFFLMLVKCIVIFSDIIFCFKFSCYYRRCLKSWCMQHGPKIQLNRPTTPSAKMINEEGRSDFRFLEWYRLCLWRENFSHNSKQWSLSNTHNKDQTNHHETVFSSNISHVNSQRHEIWKVTCS